MGIADEITRLAELRASGALTDDEFQRAKSRLLDASPPAPGIPAIAAINRLRRSRSDRWIGGVCGGIAAASGDRVVAAWRLILAALALFGGVGVLLYLLLWIFVPDERTD